MDKGPSGPKCEICDQSKVLFRGLILCNTCDLIPLKETLTPKEVDNG